MPKSNDATDMTPDDLRTISARIRKCAEAFDALASLVESTPGEKSIALAVDTFRKTLVRLEAFNRTLDRESTAFVDEVSKRIRKRTVQRRKKKS